MSRDLHLYLSGSVFRVISYTYTLVALAAGAAGAGAAATGAAAAGAVAAGAIIAGAPAGYPAGA